MKNIKISEAEWEVMEVLWTQASLTSAEITRRIQKQRKWAPNTVRTLLARLMEKKCVAAKKLDGKFLYSTTITRQQCVEKEGKSFLAKVFGGAPTPLLVHFAKQAKFSPGDIAALRQILDQKEKGSK